MAVCAIMAWCEVRSITMCDTLVETLNCSPVNVVFEVKMDEITNPFILPGFDRLLHCGQ
jgi:hypothetical protein